MNYDENYIKTLLPKRPECGHKGTFGHVLNIAGSCFYTGAAYFSSISALKVGCGRSTLASVKMVLKSVSTLGPDIILMPLESTSEDTISPKALTTLEKVFGNFEAISIGCGISQNNDTINFFEKCLKSLMKFPVPIVIDADGLSMLGKKQIPQLPRNVVLTPHPKEMSMLMNVNIDNIVSQPEFWARKCAEKYNCTAVLKLHNTIIADNKGHFYVNQTGNTGLSHAGSGDILCGMISGFLSQGLDCFEASVLAVYLHGKTAQIASKDLTEYSTISSVLLDYIPRAIKSIL